MSRPSPTTDANPANMPGLHWTFGNAGFNDRTLELTVNGAVVELERKPQEVLRYLLGRPGEAVSKDDILGAVWPGRILSETVLKKCVSRLREVLGDDEQAVIKTLHGYGYKLVAPVEVERLAPTLVFAPDFEGQAASQTRRCAALIVDIAGTVGLRSEIGDSAAGRRIRHLLDAIIGLSRSNGGEFIKSYGDDVLAIFERDAVANAARVAVGAQQLAADAGLQLYAGLHYGDIEFRHTMGHPDALGLTVNIAARLHKLTEGAPGRIFLAEDTVQRLPPELRIKTARYGSRDLKGIGLLDIWTLEWESSLSTVNTIFADAEQRDGRAAALLLQHELGSTRVPAQQKSCIVGRGKDCALRVPDPEPRVSSSHLMIELISGRWFVQDISRNGTWVRDERTGEAALLPYCNKTLLPPKGALCLGRPFEEDAAGHFTVKFEISAD